MDQISQIIAALDRQNEQRLTGRTRAGAVFEAPATVLKAAMLWSGQTSRPLASVRDPSFASALSALGLAFGAGPAAYADALSAVIPRADLGDHPSWLDLPANRRSTLLASAAPVGTRRDVLEHLLMQDNRASPTFWTKPRVRDAV